KSVRNSWPNVECFPPEVVRSRVCSQESLREDRLFSRPVAVMEAAQVLAPLLLFVGNAVCGILAHWLHLRLDAKQRHPRYFCCAMLFTGGLLLGISLLELLPQASDVMSSLQPHFPFAEVTLSSGFLLSFLGQELLRAYSLFRNRRIMN
ncbi:unnamed protein product, partial [Ixodes pacificus]